MTTNTIAALVIGLLATLPSSGHALSLLDGILEEPAPSTKMLELPEPDPLANNPALKILVAPPPAAPAAPPAPEVTEERSETEPSEEKVKSHGFDRRKRHSSKSAKSGAFNPRNAPHLGKGKEAEKSKASAASRKQKSGFNPARSTAMVKRGKEEKETKEAKGIKEEKAVGAEDNKVVDASGDANQEVHEEFDRLIAEDKEKQRLSKEKQEPEAEKVVKGAAGDESTATRDAGNAGFPLFNNVPGRQAGVSGSLTQEQKPSRKNEPTPEESVAKEEMERLEREERGAEEMNALFNDMAN